MNKYEVEVHTRFIKDGYEYYAVEANTPEEARDKINESLQNGTLIDVFNDDEHPTTPEHLSHYVTRVYNEEGDPIL